ncbi:hypothetical protein NQZ68_014274 [Dissostichus eleginoides]|nr:hypothetical protein NQZ68_014274 [Dissostichus eleginoides]
MMERTLNVSQAISLFFDMEEEEEEKEESDDGVEDPLFVIDERQYSHSSGKQLLSLILPHTPVGLCPAEHQEPRSQSPLEFPLKSPLKSPLEFPL